jgi:hypothetical protein
MQPDNGTRKTVTTDTGESGTIQNEHSYVLSDFESKQNHFMCFWFSRDTKLLHIKAADEEVDELLDDNQKSNDYKVTKQQFYLANLKCVDLEP